MYWINNLYSTHFPSLLQRQNLVCNVLIRIIGYVLVIFCIVKVKKTLDFTSHVVVGVIWALL